MFSTFRKFYLKMRVFFYSRRRAINGIVVKAMILILFYLFVNSIVIERLLIGKAHNDEINQRYSSAISLYNVAYFYYYCNHYSEDNKKIYLEIPYRISMCYLKAGDREKSVENMLLGITAIQKQYGIMSKETGYFIRKYLIEYYLENNKNVLAHQEFDNLLVIYRTVGYNDNEMSDIIRLSGDLYYNQHQYETAMGYYEKAYKEISQQNQIDYEVFSKIVCRICAYEIENQRVDNAVNIYKSSIDILRSSGRKQNELTATLLLRLGDLYAKSEDNQVSRNAIPYYEEAIEIIKTLPNTTFLKQNLKAYLLILKDLDTKDAKFTNVQKIDDELTRMKRFSFLY